MHAAIAELTVALETMETNEPINRAAGNIEQADLEAANAADYRQALTALRNALGGSQLVRGVRPAAREVTIDGLRYVPDGDEPVPLKGTWQWVGHKELAALRADAGRYRKLVATGNYCPASIGTGWGLGGRATKAQLDAKADELPAVGAA